jgi:uncharacterized membrane protein
MAVAPAPSAIPITRNNTVALMKLFYAPGVTTQVSTRIAAFDRLRGLIIVLMAIDHASFFIARVHPMEIWSAPPPYYADTAGFLTRWLTHLCAPGFFLLMGMGLVWFAESRRAAGWSDGRITRYFMTRGAILLVVQHLLENPAWLLGIVSADPSLGAAAPALPGAGGDVMLAFAVLSALGAAMIFWGVAWRIPDLAVAAVVVVASQLSGLVIPAPSEGSAAIPFWKMLLLVPGQSGIAQNLYPWVSWLTPAGVGLLAGRFLLRHPGRLHAFAAGAGAVGLAAFVTLRVLHAGEFHPMGEGLIGWLTVTKYPPSAAFLTLMLGLNFLLLAMIARWPARWLAPLEVFGRAPFFFYLTHLWSFGVLSWACRTGASLTVMYLVWVAVVLALYPACAWWARVKFAKPATSVWRMF